VRAAVAGLETPTPLVALLPAIYQEDLFTAQFMGGFDDVLAPIFTTLDCLDAYIDPWLTPDDFMEWLAGWLGVVIDEGWPVERSRALIANIADLYRWRGTARGLSAELAIYTGGTVDISETGGVAWSLVPGGPMPGEDSPRLAVRVTVDDPERINQRIVDQMINAAKPAHVVHAVEIAKRTTTNQERKK
jgi:phage tail-like protein